MFGIGKKNINKENNSLWFQEIVKDTEHLMRINSCVDIKTYLLRQHKVLQRPNYKWKEDDFTTAKIVLNIIKTIINSHVSYLIGNPISLNGNPNVVNVFNRINKKGNYDKINYQIVRDLYTYGNAFEYVYYDPFDGNKIKSHIIENCDAFPVYNSEFQYVSFIEHWKDNATYDEHYIVYYPHEIETYVNSQLIDTKPNTTGALPIHYRVLDSSYYEHYGEPFVNDLIPVIDAIEFLISKLEDGVTVHSLSPLGVAIGKRIETRIPKELVGAILNIGDEGGDFKFATAVMDHDSVKLLLDNLWAQFYAIGCVPSTSMGQANIANVSETSLRLLYAKMHDKAVETQQALAGFNKRHDCFRKLLLLNGENVSDEDYDTLNVCFNVNRPVDTYSLMEELAIQRSMGAISIESIVNKSPYTNEDVVTEMDRLIAEKVNLDDAVQKEQIDRISTALNNVNARRSVRFNNNTDDNLQKT